MEKKHFQELEESRSEIATLKKKLERNQDALDETQKKIGLSKEDGKLENKQELEDLRAQLRELEGQLRSQAGDFKKHRDDHSAMAGRLASALQVML